MVNAINGGAGAPEMERKLTAEVDPDGANSPHDSCKADEEDRCKININVNTNDNNVTTSANVITVNMNGSEERHIVHNEYQLGTDIMILEMTHNDGSIEKCYRYQREWNFILFLCITH